MDGAQILAAREARGLSRLELAHKAGVSAETLRRIEVDGVTPRAKTARLLAQVFEGTPTPKDPTQDGLLLDVVRRFEASGPDGRKAIALFASWVAQGGFVSAHDALAAAMG